MAIDLTHPDAFAGAEAALKILIKAKHGPIIVKGGKGSGQGGLLPPPNIIVQGGGDGQDGDPGDPQGPQGQPGEQGGKNGPQGQPGEQGGKNGPQGQPQPGDPIPQGPGSGTGGGATKTGEEPGQQGQVQQGGQSGAQTGEDQPGSEAGGGQSPLDDEEKEKIMQGIKNDQQEKADKKAEAAQDAFDKLAAAGRRGDFAAFTNDLYLAIAQQVREVNKYEDGYERGYNPSYASSGALMPKDIRQERKEIPNIYVFFDISGSCIPFVQKGYDALAALKPFVDRKQLEKPIVKCFADWLGDITVDDKGNLHLPNCGGGTSGFDEVLDFIYKSTNKTGKECCKNVIIISDSDINYIGKWKTKFNVQGHVFWLWCNGNAAVKPQQYLKGDRGSTFYDI